MNTSLTNVLQYQEKINAFYTQIGFKISKISMLYGLRYEDSDIDINQLGTGVYKTKNTTTSSLVPFLLMN